MLDKIIRFSLRNKLVVGIITLAMIGWGIWNLTRIPIDAVPDITNNQVQIITISPTLAGQEVEQLVTFPIEQSIANLPDLKETRSISRFGLSVITAVFDEGVDIYFARQLVNEKLKEAEDNIPKGLGTPELAPVSTGLGEIYQYIIHPKKGSEDKYSLKDLRTMQDWIVARQLNGTKGIAEINSFGGELKQYEVAVNPNRLKAMGVSITDIFNALEKNNQNTGGAYIDKKPTAYFIRGIGLVTSLDDVRNIAVKKTNEGIPIFIRDVADVDFGHAVRYGALTYNGEKEAVGGIVMMLKGENSNEVVKRIKEKIPGIQKSLPDDIVIEPYLDRADLVHRTIKTVQKNLLEGALIVIFVLVLFLGNMRAGLIVASAIPLSMLFAISLMNTFGVSANLMSLGAIDFGLIVDGAVIIVEATLHLLKEKKVFTPLTSKQMDQVVEESAERMMSSAAFGQIIILIVYIPILTLVGVEGKMFRPMALAVSFAILGALLLSLTYIPMMSSIFLSRKISQKKNISDRLMDFFMSIYQPLLKKAIHIKYSLVLGTIALFAISLFIFGKMGAEFIPQLQEGNYAVEFILPQSTSLSQSIETSMLASRRIREIPEVSEVIGKTGSAEIPTDPMPPGTSDLMIIIKPKKEWRKGITYTGIRDSIEKKLSVIPGAVTEVTQPIQMRFNELMTGIRQDVAVKIFGENLDTLLTYANKVSESINDVEGVAGLQVEQVAGLPQIDVLYNRDQMAIYGINVEDVNNALSTAFAGKSTGQVFENERRFDLVVRLDSAHRKNIEDVSNLMIPTSIGNQIPLSQVAVVSYKESAAQISREEGKRRIVIGFNVKGRDIQSVVNDIQEKLEAEVKLPTGYFFTYGGQFENLKDATNRLLIAVPTSLLLIFIVLYFTFSSLKEASLIFTAIPMSAIGGVFALLLRGMPFSISAGVGFIALFGVAVLNGVVLISTFNQLEKSGETNILRRVLDGTRARLRPVLMTATVASLGFLPMALSNGAGAEVQKPLATVVIGGLATATFLTLFVLPMLYIIFNSKINFNYKPKMNILLPFILLVGLSLSFNTELKAQQTITVDDAINIALNNNGLLKSKELQIRAAESLRKTAGEIPKLDISAQLGQYNSPTFDNAYSAVQSIPFPSLFSARKKQLTEEVKSHELQKSVSINEIRNNVRAYFYQIRFLQSSRNELYHLDSLYNDFIKIAELRYKTGESKKVEISTAKARQGEIHLLLYQNEVDIAGNLQRLKTIMNIQDAFSIDSATELQPIPLNNIFDSTTLSNHPYLEMLQQENTVLERNKDVEKAQSLPEFTLGYTNQSLIGFHEVKGQERFYGGGNRFNYGNIGIAIPLSRRASKARVQSLDYQIQANQASIEQQESLMQTELKNKVQQYQQDLKEYNYYHSQALPNAQDIVSAALLGYRTGDVGYVEYLFALQTSADIQLNYLKSIQKLNQTVIDILSLINQ